VSDFGVRLLSWFDAHGRKDLPWQRDATAYGIWISEIMLQQTQVRTVIPYYERFMARFPDVFSLADASLDTVLSNWSGLGYYARARNLLKAAQLIRDDFGGRFPDEFDQLTALPGIGRSTAGAILSLAYGQRWPILDGNAKRVLARHAAIAGWPGKSDVARQLWDLAERHTPQARVGAYTQAIMDLGATLCTRSQPACTACPVNTDCRARQLGAQTEYPGRKPKRARPLKSTTMVLAVNEDAVYLERRPASGIWGGLWSLPEIGDTEVPEWCERVLQLSSRDVEPWSTLRHSFSHYDLDIQPVVVRLEATSSKVADSDDAIWHRLDDLPPGGIAAPVRLLLDNLKTDEHVSKN
jgi:A/G-specific adenine glycosylase